VLGALNMGCCNEGYCDVLSLDIVPSESFTWRNVHLSKKNLKKVHKGLIKMQATTLRNIYCTPLTFMLAYTTYVNN
jgi:hypothetical protein